MIMHSRDRGRLWSADGRSRRWDLGTDSVSVAVMHLLLALAGLSC